MTITDKVVPNLVGVDLGCGIYVIELDVKEKDIDFQKLDNIIRGYVPYGQDIRTNPHRFYREIEADLKKVKAPFGEDKARLSLGTLGGGNHYLELGISKDGKIYLTVHSGSRNLGLRVATHYQKEAIRYHTKNKRKEEIDKIISELKAQGRHLEIEQTIKNHHSKMKVPKSFCYVEGELLEDYLHDIKIAQKYAALNRKAMLDEIIVRMGWLDTVVSSFDIIHNYIDIENMILRKGAISAQKGERVIVPINMRDDR